MADYYTTGQITLTNGSASIVGIGTAWDIANVAGGTIFVEAEGNPLPLDAIEDDTHAVASIEWTGATGTYNYALLRASAFSEQLEANSNIIGRLLVGMEAGTIYRYDKQGDLADLNIYDERAEGFAFLATDVNPAQLYVKASSTSGDWRGPFSYGTGPQGVPGPVSHVEFAPVATGAAGSDATMVVTGFGTVDDPFVVALTIPRGNKGDDGAGTGDVKAPSTAVTIGNLAAFNATNGKLLKQLTPAQVKTLLSIAGTDVSFDNTTANLAGSPTTVQAAINALAASAGGSSKNDALFALKIADLEGQRLGMVGGIADPFDDETGVNTGLSSNQSYDAANDWYTPSLIAGTSAILFTADSDATIGGTRSYRQKYLSAGLAASGSYIRVQFTGPAAGSAKQVSGAFFGRSAASGNAWDMDTASTTPVRLTFSGSNSVTPPVGGSVWSDWVAFPLDNTKDHVVAMDMVATSGTNRYRNSVAPNTAYYTKDGGSPEAGTPAVSGYSNAAFSTFATGVEVKSTAATLNNMTVRSVNYAAPAVPSQARIGVQLADTVTLVPNTDFFADVTRDGGTTWTAAVLTQSMSFNGTKFYEAPVNLSAQPSGSSMGWRFRTANNKSVAFSGVVLQQS